MKKKYRGCWIVVESVRNKQEVYINGHYYTTVATESPAKAVNLAMEFIDDYLDKLPSK